MADDPKEKPTAGFQNAAALVVVLLAYPLSFGPACWITNHTNTGACLLPFFYQPILSGLSVRPTCLSAAIEWYACLGAARGWSWAPDSIPISDDEWVAFE